MGIPDVILRDLPLVPLALVLEKVDDEAFLKQGVPLVLLVPEDGHDCGGAPFPLSAWGGDSVFVQTVGDAVEGLTSHEPEIDVSYHLGFLFISIRCSLNFIFLHLHSPVFLVSFNVFPASTITRVMVGKVDSQDFTNTSFFSSFPRR